MARIERHTTQTVWVGNVPLGSCHPIVVQSMTNTDTADVETTVAQVATLAQAGSELVRVTVNTRAAAEKVPEIVARLEAQDVRVPIIGDFHFNGHVLLREYPDCASALAKYRINPGNVGKGDRHDENFATMIRVAIDHDKPVRIGVNWGSLDGDLLTTMMDENAASAKPLDARDVMIAAMIESAVRSAEHAVKLGLPADKIVLSVKMSDVQDVIEVYRALATRTDHPLHVGLTEAGLGTKAVVNSSAALAILLQQGIGDTIRASLTPRPGGDRSEEVRLCQQVLQGLGFRHFMPQVAACPGCGRTTSTFFQSMAEEIQTYLTNQMPAWRARYPGVEQLKVAVMGCIVNGPGESKHADLGISLPGTGESPRAPVYVDGEKVVTLSGDHIVREFIQMVDDYVERRFGAVEAGA